MVFFISIPRHLFLHFYSRGPAQKNVCRRDEYVDGCVRYGVTQSRCFHCRDTEKTHWSSGEDVEFESEGLGLGSINCLTGSCFPYLPSLIRPRHPHPVRPRLQPPVSKSIAVSGPEGPAAHHPRGSQHRPGVTPSPPILKAFSLVLNVCVICHPSPKPSACYPSALPRPAAPTFLFAAACAPHHLPESCLHRVSPCLGQWRGEAHSAHFPPLLQLPAHLSMTPRASRSLLLLPSSWKLSAKIP